MGSLGPEEDLVPFPLVHIPDDGSGILFASGVKNGCGAWEGSAEIENFGMILYENPIENLCRNIFDPISKKLWKFSKKYATIWPNPKSEEIL